MRSLTVITLLIATSITGMCAGPILPPARIQAEIKEANEYKTVSGYFFYGRKGRKVKIANGVPFSKHVTFFNDSILVAMYSVVARQQMSDFKPEEIELKGLLHAYVDGTSRAHLVLKIGDKIVQPVQSKVLNSNQQDGFGASAFKFDFDVTPEDLTHPLTVILIDGDGFGGFGSKEQKRLKNPDLKGILD